MSVKLLYDPDTLRPLGAQIVGGDGVDKRIDVLATAIQLGADLHTIADLDLAYAPPFGSAKDPVHMAAFAATNELDGLVRYCQPDALLDGKQVVDVRTQQEVMALPLSGAVNIPIDDLRQRYIELDPSRPTVTVCASGLRGYVAARFLMQLGFTDVTDLAGGMHMRHHALAAGQNVTTQSVR